MLKISELPSPAIAGVIRAKTKNQAIAGIKNCVYDGATMIDLHLSCLENANAQTLRDIFASTRLPVLALNYNQKCDCSDAGYTEEHRVHSFFLPLKQAQPVWICKGIPLNHSPKTVFMARTNTPSHMEIPKRSLQTKVLLRNNAPLSKEFMHAAHRCFFPVIQAFFECRNGH